MTDTRYYSVTQVAEQFHVTPSAVYRWIREGELGCVRRGERFTVVTDRQLEEFVGRYTVPADKRNRR